MGSFHACASEKTPPDRVTIIETSALQTCVSDLCKRSDDISLILWAQVERLEKLARIRLEALDGVHGEVAEDERDIPADDAALPSRVADFQYRTWRSRTAAQKPCIGWSGTRRWPSCSAIWRKAAINLRASDTGHGSSAAHAGIAAAPAHSALQNEAA